jgi:hypothetical protein
MSGKNASASLKRPVIVLSANGAAAAAVVPAASFTAPSSTHAQHQSSLSADVATASAPDVAMETEPAADASAQLPIASAIPAPPLFVSVPVSRLPAALLLKLANEFLEDEAAQSLAQCCSAMPPLLRT